ncbi:transcriptional regulator, AraC family [Ekhidna lutea]|uniref:Transcriptional regulator, AraC family n=1 Tax=Ekhidna lutea TaxID=447679 RepID=A0A239HTZ3_EKHLU|nr:AraC family transcriptional regulator [Ekhidna lutea]SNS84860.1 transcriptional regulator, AraC family [Ekhidna lutea]
MPRCIEAVKDALNESNVGFEKVELGEAQLKRRLDKTQQANLAPLLAKKGFELLEDKTSAIISNIKGLIIEQIHYSHEPLKMNFSTYLSEKIGKDYSTMSKLFSSVESITIEKFITKQKIERVKELIIYDQLSLSQISYQMNYSSVAHLSAQFKKETGLTPTEFKKQKQPQRRSIDNI